MRVSRGWLGLCNGSVAAQAVGGARGSRGSHKAADVFQSPVPRHAGSGLLLQLQEHSSGVMVLSPVGIHLLTLLLSSSPTEGGFFHDRNEFSIL